ncbi:MAG: hypothetical protein JKY96_02315 [Phycisphaerales bacterium]|nr:hypothetical protein [Phycisphaerales bacterium]
MKYIAYDDEGLYDMRHNFTGLIELIDEYYIYTRDQLQVLEDDIQADLDD